MRTSECIGNITGALPGATLGAASVPALLPVELVVNKTNSIVVQINGKLQPVRVRAIMDVLTAFNDSGTDTVSVGSGVGTNIFNAQTVAATGTFTGAAILIEDDYVDITIAYAGQNSNGTTGRAIVYLEVTPLTLISQDE